MLGYLQLQLFGFESAGVQGALYRSGEVSLLELAGRDVDGDRALDAEPPLKSSDLLAGLKKDPLADGHDEASLFGQWNKSVWPYQAEFSTVPSKQRLHSNQSTVGKGDLRLIEDLKLLIFKSGA